MTPGLPATPAERFDRLLVTGATFVLLLVCFMLLARDHNAWAWVMALLLPVSLLRFR